MQLASSVRRVRFVAEFVMSEGGHGGYPARSPLSSSTTGHSSSSHHRYVGTPDNIVNRISSVANYGLIKDYYNHRKAKAFYMYTLRISLRVRYEKHKLDASVCGDAVEPMQFNVAKTELMNQ